MASMLVRELIKHESRTQKTCLIGENDYYCETRIEVAKGIGLCICGGFSGYEDGDSQEIYQFYPYNDRNSVSSTINGEICERVDKFNYICIIVDRRNEALMVFRLDNITEYMGRIRDNFPKEIKKSYLTGLSLSGKVILGIQRKKDILFDLQQDKGNRKNAFSHNFSYTDEEALEKVDFSTKLKFKYNIYNYIDTSFSPTSLEPENYNILGNILEVELVENRFSKEKFYNLKLDVNHVPLHVLIHSKDLEGEPKVGYRYKGKICLFGKVEFE